MKKSTVIFLFSFSLFFSALGSTQALDFFVDNTNDAGAGSLRQAILDANGNPGPDNIIITAQGTVDLTTPLDTITQTVSIEGPGADLFTLNAATIAGGGRILTVDDTNPATGISLTLSGVHLTGGVADNGGAIWLGTGETLDLSQSQLSNNQANISGGAIYLDLDGTVRIEDSVFTANHADDQGGAVFLCCATTEINLEIRNSLFQNNSASSDGSSAQGGAIFSCCSETANITVEDSQILNNDASDTMDPMAGQGGGLFYCCSTNINAEVHRTVLEGNTTGDQGAGHYGCCSENLNTNISENTYRNNISGGDGGGLYTCCSGSGQTNIDSTSFINNQAQGPGGNGAGYYNCCGPGVTITNSTFDSNQAGDQGGGFYQCCSTLEARVTNCTFNGNNADGVGGAIFYDGEDLMAPFNLSFLTVTENSAQGTAAAPVGAGIPTNNGGGIFAESPGTVTLINSIVAQNPGGDCGQNNGGVFTSLGNNLDSDDTCSLMPGLGDLPMTDPLLDAMGLAENGGPTQTIALQEASPAVDHIDPSLCNDANDNPVDRDQRGVPRPLDGSGNGNPACDIGAYELARTNLSILKQASAELVSPGDSLNYTLVVNNLGNELAPNTIIMDTLPGGVTFVSASEECLADGLTLICDLGDLAAGAEASVVISVTINDLPQGTEITNIASVVFNGVDTDPSDNTSQVQVTVNVGAAFLFSGSGCQFHPLSGNTIAWPYGLLLAAAIFTGLLRFRHQKRSW